MNEDSAHIIETADTNIGNKFPIVAQLGVLGLIVMAIFASLLLIEKETGTDYEENIVHQTNQVDNEAQLLTAVTDEQKIADLTLQAQAAFVWDVRQQKILYAENAEATLPLASITKLMTALLTHELLATEALTSIPVSAIKQEGSSGLLVGEVLRAQALRDFALVASSNDAAYALGATVGKLLGDADPAEQFIKGMNIRAEELGLDSLTFWNTTGLDLSLTKPGAVGSARDVSLLMAYIIKNYPDIISATQQKNLKIYNENDEYHDITNTNEIVLNIPGILGSKTGYTDLAGGNLTIAFNVGLDHPIIITVLGSTRDERFSDMLKLVESVNQTVLK